MDHDTPSVEDGRSALWGPIIKRYQRQVVLSLLAQGHRYDQAIGITQKTWARLIQQRAEGKLREMKFPGLAIRQARFLALDEHRRNQRTPELLPMEGSDIDTVVDPNANPEV